MTRCLTLESAMIALLLTALLSSPGCRAQAPAAEHGSPAYQSFYAVPVPAAPEPRGTLKGDYQWAAAAATRDEAFTRWREFLRQHRPPGGEYQDAFQRNYVKSAQYELMRLEYLAGHVAEGDALLKELEDVRGR